MNRMVCFGTILCVLLLYTLKSYDPSNTILWFTTLNKTAMALNAVIAAIALFIGIKGEFYSQKIRSLLKWSGAGILAIIALSALTPIVTLPLNAVNYVFLVLCGLIMATAGLTQPEPEEEPYRLFIKEPSFMASLSGSVRRVAKKQPVPAALRARVAKTLTDSTKLPSAYSAHYRTKTANRRRMAEPIRT